MYIIKNLLNLCTRRHTQECSQQHCSDSKGLEWIQMSLDICSHFQSLPFHSGADLHTCRLHLQAFYLTAPQLLLASGRIVGGLESGRVYSVPSPSSLFWAAALGLRQGHLYRTRASWVSSHCFPHFISLSKGVSGSLQLLISPFPVALPSPPLVWLSVLPSLE